MRCKPGDLAMVIRGPNRDALVRVREAFVALPAEWMCECLQAVRAIKVIPIDGRICARGAKAVLPPGSHVVFPDTYLRPLRDGEGADETLTWAGLPAPIVEVETA